jgi:RNA polymerase sigma-70 factor (ECF subfamily)
MRVVPAAAARSGADEDAALVEAVRARSPRAPGLLWDRYSTLARRILMRSLGPSADVEDALQDVFLRLFRDLHTLREPAALRSFIIGITLHVATSELRKRRARKWLLLWNDKPLPEVEPPSGDGDADQREALSRLYAILDRIDTKRRLVFVLRFVEGLELAEISAILECSLATTKRRVADAARRVTLLAAGDPLLSAYVTVKP